MNRLPMDRYEALVSLWIALGAAIGGVGRYWCAGLIARTMGETFPWGTIAVNVIGSFLIGLLFIITGPDGRVVVGTTGRQFMMTGILGGFTTFSSFSLHTLTLVQDGEWVAAAANIVFSVALCLIGAWLGMVLGRVVGT